mmetsp:Transcript_119934/g.233433  ORF Transcript_119934/g.233433 Transcript_119934/m.233433 type:complete len:113 (-) Transcript_119934:10-348(-)
MSAAKSSALSAWNPTWQLGGGARQHRVVAQSSVCSATTKASGARDAIFAARTEMTFQHWVLLVVLQQMDRDGRQYFHSFSPVCKVLRESVGRCDHPDLFSGALNPLDARLAF